MIEYVYEQETTFAPLPNKFEAGTQNVEGVVRTWSCNRLYRKTRIRKNTRNRKRTYRIRSRKTIKTRLPNTIYNTKQRKPLRSNIIQHKRSTSTRRSKHIRLKRSMRKVRKPLRPATNEILKNRLNLPCKHLLLQHKGRHRQISKCTRRII